MSARLPKGVDHDHGDAAGAADATAESSIGSDAGVGTGPGRTPIGKGCFMGERSNS